MVKNELLGSANLGTIDDVHLDKLTVRVSEKVQPTVEKIISQLDSRLAVQQLSFSITLSNNLTDTGILSA